MVRRLLIPSLLFGIALIPIVRLYLFLNNVGADNPSNDEVELFALLDKILSGEYEWRNIFDDTFSNGHSHLLPMLLHLGLAKLTHWNLQFVLNLGLAFGLIKLILIYDVFRLTLKNSLSQVFLVFLSALIFSASQISTFEFPYAAMTRGLSHLGLVLGIWGLIRFGQSWTGIGLMVFGGLLSSWSSGSGPLVWPAFLLGMWFLKIRRKVCYGAWLAGACVAASPYVYFLFIVPKSQPGGTDWLTWLNPSFFLKAIGWTFAQGFSAAQVKWRGWAGAAFFISGMLLFLKVRKKAEPRMTALLAMIFTYCLLHIWQLSMFRSGLAPWYTSNFVVFWIGLLGLAFFFWTCRTPDLEPKPVRRFNFEPVHLWSWALVAALTYFYVTSNITYEDKSFYLQSRSPVSASCLRHYENAPLPCLKKVFLFEGVQQPLLAVLGKPLKDHRLSIFSSHQVWTLQGDSFLDSVKLHRDRAVPKIFWVSAHSMERAPISDYHRLNLFLHSPNAVTWTVNLPKDLKKAEFRSAVSISPSAPFEEGADGITFQVYVERPGTEPKLLYNHKVKAEDREWSEFRIPLEEFAGQTISLRLAASPGDNFIHDWGLFRFPHLEIELQS